MNFHICRAIAESIAEEAGSARSWRKLESASRKNPAPCRRSGRYQPRFAGVDLRGKIGPDNVDTLAGEAADRAQAAIERRGFKVGAYTQHLADLAGAFERVRAGLRAVMWRQGLLVECSA